MSKFLHGENKDGQISSCQGKGANFFTEREQACTFLHEIVQMSKFLHKEDG